MLTITVVSSVTRGTYLIKVTGTSGNTTASTSIALDINAPGFTITPNPQVVTLRQGEDDSTALSIAALDRFSGSVSLAVTSPLPTGVNALWNSVPSSGTFPLTFLVSNTAQLGTPDVGNEVTVTGSSGEFMTTAQVVIQVLPPNFDLGVTSISPDLFDGSSSTVVASFVPGKYRSFYHGDAHRLRPSDGDDGEFQPGNNY